MLKILISVDGRFFFEDEDVCAYESVVWCVSLKRIVKVVYLKYKKMDNYSILLSTDTELGGEKVLQYYRLRFQIEFLLYDKLLRSFSGS